LITRTRGRDPLGDPLGADARWRAIGSVGGIAALVGGSSLLLRWVTMRSRAAGARGAFDLALLGVDFSSVSLSLLVAVVQRRPHDARAAVHAQRAPAGAYGVR